MKTTRKRLDAGWQVKPAFPLDIHPTLQLPPLPAQVPGHVHLDLHRAGVIPDPFFRLHERDVVWVDDADWTYETSFELESVPAGDGFLNFLGLDTIAEIHLNGRPLGQTDNMFVPHEFDILPFVRPGENTLAITFRSARRVGRERLEAWSAQHEAPPVHHLLWDARSFVRKAQYTFGWDWGPILISCGIWRPVELVNVPAARLLDWRYDVGFERDRATVRIEAEVERTRGKLDLPLTLVAGGEGLSSVQVDIPKGERRVTAPLTLEIDAPRRWSPADPHLYPLRLTLQSGETAVDERTARIGLRTIELARPADPDGRGEGFVIRVNGEDHFCKGANWIPADSFPSRTYDQEARLRPLLSAARDAGFTMLRVWGGGMYESDTFYDLCDELGILVWQDFPYACAYYPDDPAALQAAATEAASAVRRIHVHPSLAIWCGNNENHQMYVDNWRGLDPPRFLGQPIYETVLPAIVATHDPATPYWPGSPYGGQNPNSPDVGDRHNWNAWHGEGVEGGDWPHYAEDRARFCSEFGFASSCGLAAWDTCLAPSDREPASPAVRWHNKTGKAYETYLGYIEQHFPPVQSLEDLVYYSQLNQAEAITYGVEHYRRLKGRCWGTLFWQLNDCWPVQSWAAIDYLGERKAVYYAARRFYAPLLLSAVRNGTSVDVHLTSDLLSPISGRLTVRVVAFDGTTWREETQPVSVGANATGAVGHIDLQGLHVVPREVFVHASLARDGEAPPSETIVFLAEPKDLRLPDPRLQTSVADGESGCALTVEARQLAAHVWLSAPDLGPLQWSDNFFHLRPGEQRTLSVAGPPELNAGSLSRKLKVRSLNPAR